jgi:hypothetical protein
MNPIGTMMPVDSTRQGGLANQGLISFHDLDGMGAMPRVAQDDSALEEQR